MTRTPVSDDDVVETVRTILLGNSGIAGIVDTRIFPVAMPDATSFPALVVAKGSDLGLYDLQGDVGVTEARIQVDCYNDDGKAANLHLKRLVREQLSGYRGGPPGAPCAIQSSFVINDFDATDPSTERGGPRLRRRTIEFRILAEV